MSALLAPRWTSCANTSPAVVGGSVGLSQAWEELAATEPDRWAIAGMDTWAFSTYGRQESPWTAAVNSMIWTGRRAAAAAAEARVTGWPPRLTWSPRYTWLGSLLAWSGTKARGIRRSTGWPDHPSPGTWKGNACPSVRHTLAADV